MRKRFFFLLVCCFCCLSISAQKAVTVKGFTMTNDHIPVADRQTDLNGTPCALVKIQVLDDIERIEGNKIGEIVNRGVEKWVYMCKGSRNIRIHFKNHLPIKVAFRDYKINGLESNRVYEKKIEGTGFDRFSEKDQRPVPLIALLSCRRSKVSEVCQWHQGCAVDGYGL